MEEIQIFAWEAAQVAVGLFSLVVLGVVAFRGLRKLLYSRQSPTPAPSPVTPPTPSQGPSQAPYEEKVRAWNNRVAELEREVGKAVQNAQAKVVEGYESTLLVIRDYYEVGDDEPASAVVRCEPLLQNDPRRQGSTLSDIELVIDDQRQLPHGQNSYKFLPRPQREAWLAQCKVRREALRAGAVKKVVWDASGRAHIGADEAVQARIDAHRKHRTDTVSQAEQAFKEEVAKIRVDAVLTAREVFMKKPARRAALDKEAQERKVDVKVVEDEFVALVVKTALDRAESIFRKPNTNVLKHLTPERIKAGSLFQY